MHLVDTINDTFTKIDKNGRSDRNNKSDTNTANNSVNHQVIETEASDIKQANDFITTREAAELVNVSLRTSQLWVERGALNR